MNGPIKLMVTEDQRLLGDCLEAALGPKVVIKSTPSSPDQLARSIRNWRPDLILLGRAATAQETLELTQQIRSRHPDVKIVVHGVGREGDEQIRFLEAGAGGFLETESTLDEFELTLRHVQADELCCSSELAFSLCERVAELARLRRRKELLDTQVLTRRELEVLELIAEGQRNSDIADRLNISAHTVKNHVHSILKKLDTERRAGAIQVAYRRGLLPELS